MLNKALFASLALVLTACEPSQLEQSYAQRLDEAKADCRARGGDEFKPYGFDAWAAVVGMNKPLAFRCQRLEKHWKRGVAVYVLRRDGEQIVMNIR